MIRKISVTIEKFILQFLYTEKRLSNVILLFKVLLYPFIFIMAAYKTWRDASIITANITVSKKSIEWYLNHLYDPELQRIYIETNRGGGTLMGIETTEPDDYVVMGIIVTEPDEYEVMTMEGEDEDMEFASFGVFVPTALIAQADAISGTVSIFTVLDFVIVEF